MSELEFPLSAVEQLRDHQQQLDADGVMVGVSRQAIDEVLHWIDLSTLSPLSDGDGWQPIAEAKIREILAGTEGVTPGPWKVHGASFIAHSGPDASNVCAVGDPKASRYPSYTELPLGGSPEAFANAAHIARLDPATVAALCNMALRSSGAEAKIAEQNAEIERLKRARAPNIEFNTTDGSATRIRALSGNRSGK